MWYNKYSDATGTQSVGVCGYLAQLYAFSTLGGL